MREHEKLPLARVSCLAQSLARGATLLLLGGLDEATTHIEGVLRWIDDVSSACPRLRVVVSSRPVSNVYPSAMTTRGFRVLQVQPLTTAQVRRWVAVRALGRYTHRPAACAFFCK